MPADDHRCGSVARRWVHDDGRFVVRFVSSWATTRDDVHGLLDRVTAVV